MPLKPLTPNPSLDHFRHQARDLQAAHRRRDPEALQRLREFHPRFRRTNGAGIGDAEIGAVELKLSDAQLVTAREYGFASWAKLRAHLEDGKTVDYGLPMHERIEDAPFRRAVDLLDAGDEDGLRAHLAAHAELVRRRVHFVAGGYFEHPTLLNFVAENPTRRGHLPPNIVPVARVLLDAGADADDGTLELVASSRVAREDERQIPLIDLLCERGANPDSAMDAALVHGEFAAAEALIRRGAEFDLPTAAALGRDEDAARLLPSADFTARHLALALAAQHGRLAIVRLLLDSGENPSRYNPVGGHSHATPLHQAVWAGHFEIVRLLVARGARLDLKDAIHHGTPVGWAEYGGQSQIATYLRGAESPPSRQTE